jgi:cytochrome P450
MRLYPPVPGIGRAIKETRQFGDFEVRKGTQIFVMQYLVHRDQRYFDDPDEFRPERWLDGLERELPRCSYFPFSDGPRICIGAHFAMLEMLTVLPAIVQRFRLATPDDQPLTLDPGLTLRPGSCTTMNIERRE